MVKGRQRESSINVPNSVQAYVFIQVRELIGRRCCCRRISPFTQKRLEKREGESVGARKSRKGARRGMKNSPGIFYPAQSQSSAQHSTTHSTPKTQLISWSNSKTNQNSYAVCARQNVLLKACCCQKAMQQRRARQKRARRQEEPCVKEEGHSMPQTEIREEVQRHGRHHSPNNAKHQ